jgi:hypothetical protein
LRFNPYDSHGSEKVAPKDKSQKIKVKDNGPVDLEEYVGVVVSSEATANSLFGDKGGHALKALSIAVRSYALANLKRHQGEGADLCPGSHCMAYRPEKKKNAGMNAAQGTRGQVAVMGGKVHSTPFLSICGSCSCGKAKNSDTQGLCMYGAYKMSEQGKNYLQILQQYFSGVKVHEGYGKGKEITEADIKESPPPAGGGGGSDEIPDPIPDSDGDGSEDAKLVKEALDKGVVDQVFKRGSSYGKHIKALQRLLHKLNYDKELRWSKYKDDGDYGGATSRAVCALCTGHNTPNPGDKLTVDGAKILLYRIQQGWKRPEPPEPVPAQPGFDPAAGDQSLDLSNLTDEQKYDYFKGVVVNVMKGTFKEGDNEMNIIGVRSFRDWKRVKPKLWSWDDSLILVWKEGGQKKIKSYVATVDPARNYTVKPINALGCAHLCDGHYDYKEGSHPKHDGTGGRYGAGNQRASVTVWRDRDKDGRFSSSEKTYTGWYGINIHAGGNNPNYASGSAGCQVLFGGRSGPWKDFWSTVEKKNPGKKYQYTLIDASKLPSPEPPDTVCFAAEAGGDPLVSHADPNAIPAKFENFYKNVETAPDGFYPIGFNRGWHCGVHIKPGKNEVVAMFKGELVAARMHKVDPGKHTNGSPNFVLLRHKLIIDKKEKYFFSLYMHLREKDFKKDATRSDEIPWMQWVCSNAEKRLDKFKSEEVVLFFPGELPVNGGEVIGEAGIIGSKENGYKGIHFEIFSAEADPIIAADDPMGWKRVEDTNTNGLCDIEEILKKVDADLDGKVSRGELLQAYQDSFTVDTLRRYIIKHLSEWWVDDWEPILNASSFWKELLKPDELTDAALSAKPYGWWKNELNSEWGIPSSKIVWAYHPIRFLQWLIFRSKEAPSSEAGKGAASGGGGGAAGGGAAGGGGGAAGGGGTPAGGGKGP